jgi:hypothetical protein
MAVMIRSRAAALQIDDYLSAANCGHVSRIETNPTFIYILMQSRPQVSQNLVLDEADFNDQNYSIYTL